MSDFRNHIEEEWLEWYTMSMSERWQASAVLFDYFLSIGGILEPEPDSQSPFFDLSTWDKGPTDGRTSLRLIRRC